MHEVCSGSDTKEGQWKRVPIHRDLVYILQEILKVRYIRDAKVFRIDGNPVSPQSVRKPWDKAVKAIGLDPPPTFHGLHHTWKNNARRSGMEPEIREAILGHAYQLDPEEIRRFLTRSGVTIGDSRDKIHHVTLILSGVHHD